MRSLYESITQSRFTRREIGESILDNDKQVVKSITANSFINDIVSIVKSYYNKTVSNEDKLLLEKLWKENDLEIPGMKWYFTRYEGIQYGPAEGLCVPIVRIHETDSITLTVCSRTGIDYNIKNLNLPHWEEVAKKETKKMTDAFLRKYNKKLSNVLNMKPIEEESKYLIGIYELN